MNKLWGSFGTRNLSPRFLKFDLYFLSKNPLLTAIATTKTIRKLHHLLQFYTLEIQTVTWGHNHAGIFGVAIVNFAKDADFNMEIMTTGGN